MRNKYNEKFGYKLRFITFVTFIAINCMQLVQLCAIVHAINQNENLYVFLNYIISGMLALSVHIKFYAIAFSISMR